MQTCVQCRACETACPSSVPLRAADGGDAGAAWRRARSRRGSGPPTACSGHHRVLRRPDHGGRRRPAGPAGARPLARRLSLPPLPLAAGAAGGDRRRRVAVHRVRDGRLAARHPPGGHRRARRLRRRRRPARTPGAACCGALHVHAGLRADAARLARRVMRAFPGSAPILVDSAGCGAALQDYGHLLGTREAERFSARVHRHPRVAGRSGPTGCPPRTAGAPRRRIAVQDPCHLRHVQRSEAARPGGARPATARSVELDDDGRCCGAGGAYSALQPDLAGRIRTQKLAVIAADRRRRGGQRQPRAARCGWPAPACRSGIPLEIVAEAAGLETGAGSPSNADGR